MNRLFLRPVDVLSPSHTDAIAVVGVLIIPAELPRWLPDVSSIISPCPCLLRRRKKNKTPAAMAMATAPNTPIATPTACPVESP